MSNGIKYYSVDIVDGKETRVNYYIGPVNPCSYEGIRQCAVQRIDNLNTFDKVVCSFTMPNCLLLHMASCAWDNCGIERGIQDWQKQTPSLTIVR